MSTIALGKEIGASVALIDDLPARRLAVEQGLAVRGSVGLLELLFRKGELADLRSAFLKLMLEKAYIAEELLNERLAFVRTGAPRALAKIDNEVLQKAPQNPKL